MAAPTANNMPLNPDTTMITIKVAIDGTNRRFKLALRDLTANVFPQKLRFLLAIPPNAQVVFERYSDSAGSYITLDSANPSVYKQLYRAAKAKLKLRIKATVVNDHTEEVEKNEQPAHSEPAGQPSAARRTNYLETVLAPQSSLPTRIPAVNPTTIAMASAANVTTETLVTPAKKEESSAVNISDSSHKSPFFHDFASGIFCIDCNSCGNSIPNEHYHCSICDDGDFDLCMACVKKGSTCAGDDHWLIKRTLQNGQVVSSTTELITTKKERVKQEQEQEQQPEVAIADPIMARDVVERTCNSCIGEFPNSEFVCCTDCYDFDLCNACLITNLHGHNPSHTFASLDSETEPENSMVANLCKPGRNVSHMAICDGCDKGIVGVRHKCLNCPDWDYCIDCIGNASATHPGHRFAPLYEPIAETHTKPETHYGIYCDGPLCTNKSNAGYIRGIRYKCAICHDTDFCANCEASPIRAHNRTHPLIKFKTPVKGTSITTYTENVDGQRLATLGDRPGRIPPPPASTPIRRTSVKTAATETIPVAKSTNAATQVQTMADIQPVKSLPSAKTADLDARFVTDAIPDGTILATDTEFTQIWTMTNPGPEAWPVGCSVRYTGGDWMLNVDTEHPSTVCAIYAATESTFTDRVVNSGESFDFKVALRTPVKEGRIISYWRLKDAGGKPFGHKLWCDVRVQAPIKADLEFQPICSYYNLAPGSKAELTVQKAAPQEASGMIFPKLEKESPDSSIHQTPEEEPLEEASVKSATEDILEDVESLDLDDEDDTEDAFLTDEEYDILDASDEEFLDAAQKSVSK